MKKQINHITKLAYTGLNEAELETVKSDMGFVSNEWMTFLQAKLDNRQIKKGSKGTKLFRIIEYISKNSKGQDDAFKGKKNFVVFNMDQTEKEEINV